MANTKDNLQDAFAGESQASRKYLFFAEKAEQEGQKQIAKLFRAAAEAETVHARNHLRVMEGIGTTVDNLKTAISGEYYEMTEMYPNFITQSKTEKNAKAESSFDWANKVEKVHHVLFHQALKDLEAAKKSPAKACYVCQNCGNTVEGDAPDRCPICGVTKNMFKKID